MHKMTEKSWERLEQKRDGCWEACNTIAHNQAYGGLGNERQAAAAEAEIHEARMVLAGNLRHYHRLIINGLELYGCNSEWHSVEADWPAIVAKDLQTTNFVSVSNGEFAESEGLNRLDVAFDVLAAARDAELRGLEEARAREIRERDTTHKLADVQAHTEYRKTRLQSVMGVIGVVAGSLLTLLASSARDCTHAPRAEAASVQGDIEVEGPSTSITNSSMRCEPALNGLSAITDGKRYVVQTDGAVPLPLSVACVVIVDGRSSLPVIVPLEAPGHSGGPAIAVPAK